jgi:hypothetical protein
MKFIVDGQLSENVRYRLFEGHLRLAHAERNYFKVSPGIRVSWSEIEVVTRRPPPTLQSKCGSLTRRVSFRNLHLLPCKFDDAFRLFHCYGTS